VNETDESVEGVKITDKRRIDPVTGQLRVTSTEPVPGAFGPPEAEAESQIDDVAALLAERTADLQRLQAEYTNYRRRVDRDRDGVRDAAAGAVLSALLPVLDDIDRARAHDEFDGAFRTVGEAVEAIFGRLGVERFGVEGEPFDPTVHEALTHEERDDVEVATITAVYQAGFRYAGRVLRPARVAVADKA
jgi:molecular chaperone GrpE